MGYSSVEARILRSFGQAVRKHRQKVGLSQEKLAELAGKTSLISGLKITYRVEKGRIYTKIIEVAQDIQADYIIMGTHSKGAITHTFLGSVAERVLRRVRKPAFIFPAA